MKLDPIDAGWLRVLRKILAGCPRPGTLDDLRATLDAALSSGSFDGELEKVTVERNHLRAKLATALADARTAEQRGYDRGLEAAGDIVRCLLDERRGDAHAD